MPSKGTTTQRGYGYDHRKLRAEIKPMVAAGKATCWRCQQRINPGTPWDLGHADEHQPDGTRKYMGPEHAKTADCTAGGNRATAGRTTIMNGPPVDTSRLW